MRWAVKSLWLIVTYLFVVSFVSSSSSLAAAAATLPSNNNNHNKNDGPQATHDGLRQLTSSNFTTLTGKGAWVIEFFMPRCPHCIHFGPTWSELAKNKEFLRTNYPDAPLSLAQVNCEAQRDLCSEAGIQVIPWMAVYHDGQKLDQVFTGNKEHYHELSSWVDQLAKQYRTKKGVSDEPSSSSSSPSVVENPLLAEKLAVANGTIPVSNSNVSSLSSSPPPSPSSSTSTESKLLPFPISPNPNGKLLSYGQPPIDTPQHLEQWLGEGSGQGPTFIKFFAPWCPHCKAMAHAFENVAESLKSKINVIQVNCDEYSSLCRDYHIRGFPTLRMYNDGQMSEFSGGRNHDAMLKWALEVGSPSGLKPISTINELTTASQSDQVLFLYLHSPATSPREMEIIKKASKVLTGKRVVMYSSSEPALLDRYAEYLVKKKGSSSSSSTSSFTTSSETTGVSIESVSGLLVFKDHSTLKPTKVYATSDFPDDTQTAVTQLSRWISQHRYPLLLELNTANFDETIYNQDGVLVVLAALSDTHHFGQPAVSASETATRDRDLELEQLKSIALIWREDQSEQPHFKNHPIIWTWIDADRGISFLEKLYHLAPQQLPHLFLINGSNLEYYDLSNSNVAGTGTAASLWISSPSIFITLSNVFSGQVASKSSRTFLDRGVRHAGSAIELVLSWVTRYPMVSYLMVFMILVCLFWYLSSVSSSTAARGSGLPIYSKDVSVKAD